MDLTYVKKCKFKNDKVQQDVTKYLKHVLLD